MRKYAYLARLEELLAALPAQELQEALNYYEEYFDAAGNENEEKTAEELGDPANVARNILEGEGIETPVTTRGENPESASEAPAISENLPEPQAATGAVPPAGPEPPPLADPEAYPRKGTGTNGASRPKVTRRIWLAFWLLVAVALVIQLSVLALGLGHNRGGESAYAVAEYAESTTASSQELAAEGPAPTDAG